MNSQKGRPRTKHTCVGFGGWLSNKRVGRGRQKINPELRPPWSDRPRAGGSGNLLTSDQERRKGENRGGIPLQLGCTFGFAKIQFQREDDSVGGINRRLVSSLAAKLG